MKTRLAILVSFVCFVTLASFAQVMPHARGRVTNLGRVDGGTLPPLGSSVGGLVYDSIGDRVLLGDGGSWTPLLTAAVPFTLSSVFVGAIAVAGTSFGGDVLPATAFTVNQATFRTSVAGSGGTTNFAFRVTDGTNTCDCTFACNTAAGNINTTCAGTAGTGCALPASASLTYSINSIGNCTTGPTIVGNVNVRGIWR